MSFDERLPQPIPSVLELSQERIGILALIPADNSDPRIDYLSAVRRVHGPVVKVVGVREGTGEDAQRFGENMQLYFPIMGDSSYQIFRWARVNPKHGHGGFLIYDREGRVKFFDFFLPEEDLVRQLVEKYALGQVDYSYKSAPVHTFRKGAPFPALTVRSFDGKPVNSLDVRGKWVFVFQGLCHSCKVTHYLGHAREAITQLVGRGDLREESVIMLFHSGVVDEQSLGAEGWPLSQSFVIPHGATEEHAGYDTRFLPEASEPLVVVTDRTGDITQVWKLNDLLRSSVPRQEGEVLCEECKDRP
ncbi:MAG: hypothetical protein ACRD88_04205 [Terriglobia bacterium]